MDKKEFIKKADDILSDIGIAMLATVDKDNKPWARWITPIFYDMDKGVMAFVTAPDFRKVKHIKENNNVSFSIGKMGKNEVITIQAKARIIEDPTLNSELMISIGPKLSNFWRANKGGEVVSVLCDITWGEIFHVDTGNRDSIHFN